MPDCDTLHALVKEYRETRKILLNIEHRLMLAMAPEYDQLPLMGKVMYVSVGVRVGLSVSVCVHVLLLAMAPEHDQLPLMGKV